MMHLASVATWDTPKEFKNIYKQAQLTNNFGFHLTLDMFVDKYQPMKSVI